MTTGKTIALTIHTFVGKVMSLLFNMLFRFVIAFLPTISYRRGKKEDESDWTSWFSLDAQLSISQLRSTDLEAPGRASQMSPRGCHHHPWQNPWLHSQLSYLTSQMPLAGIPEDTTKFQNLSCHSWNVWWEEVLALIWENSTGIYKKGVFYKLTQQRCGMALGLEILSEPMLHTRYWARQLGNRKMNLPLSPQRAVRHVVN